MVEVVNAKASIAANSAIAVNGKSYFRNVAYLKITQVNVRSALHTHYVPWNQGR
jgi:hypothetical protein